jgi:hypothetical protein
MRSRDLRIVTLVALAFTWFPARARAADFTFGGKIQTDVRFRAQEKTVGSYVQRLDLPAGVSLNQNLINVKVGASVGAITGVAEIDFVWLGYSRGIDSVADLSANEKQNPYFLRPQALFLEGKDLLLEGLDLRIGQQLVQWGVGDQFNPTNTLNPNDIYDPLLFGQQVANLMARVDYTFKGRFTLSAVLVPIFKPAVLPSWAPIATAFTDRVPLTDDALRQRIQTEQALTGRLLGEAGVPGVHFPTVVSQAIPVLPETSFGNMQVAFRVAGVLAEQDVALSYYSGRTDLPQPFLNYTRMKRGQICNPVDPGQCVDGVLETETYLGYPRVQVVGLNAAGQMNPLGWISKKVKPLGYRLEAGLFFPQESSIALQNDRLDFGMFVQPAGEYDYSGKPYRPGDPRPMVVRSTPFAKWTAGLDYTFSEHIYANVQWVHGFADEFGAGDFISEGWSVREGGVTTTAAETLVRCYNPLAGVRSGEKCAREVLRPRLGDYLVLGVDLKFREERILVRLFTIWDLSGVTEDLWDPSQNRRVRIHHSLFTADGFSAVIFPELNYNFKNGLELGAGALLLLGKPDTKFGDPSTGGSLLWTRARYSY